jgi:hypothetical protein
MVPSRLHSQMSLSCARVEVRRNARKRMGVASFIVAVAGGWMNSGLWMVGKSNDEIKEEVRKGEHRYLGTIWQVRKDLGQDFWKLRSRGTDKPLRLSTMVTK